MNDVVYRYDGTYSGVLSCIFESYAAHEHPADIFPDTDPRETLYPIKSIQTDDTKAQRVEQGILQKVSEDARYYLQRAFLTSIPERELAMLNFVRTILKSGSMIATDPAVELIQKSVRALNGEAHLFTGFVRFSEVSGALIAIIEPKNSVLPLLNQHFCQRLGLGTFIIYDKTHRQALIHSGTTSTIAHAESFELPVAGEEEKSYRALWQCFYDTVAIAPRYNPKCRQTHVPKRFWGNMTELSQAEPQGSFTALAPQQATPQAVQNPPQQ